MFHLLIGDKGIFAIESEVNKFFDSKSQIGLGYFNIYVSGLRYGVREYNATILGNSYYAVQERFKDRGHHDASFAASASAQDLAQAYLDVVYWGRGNPSQIAGHPIEEFSRILYESKLIWAPDGDAAFDDGSHVLQFDVDEDVRLIAMKQISEGQNFTIRELSDITLKADKYYDILREWFIEFSEFWGRYAN